MVRGTGLLYLTGGGRGCLAAHAGRVDRFGRDQIQVLVVRDLVEAVTIFQELDVQVLIDLLEKDRHRSLTGSSLQGHRPVAPYRPINPTLTDFRLK